MNKLVSLIFLLIVLLTASACNNRSSREGYVIAPTFPYDSYLESIGEDEAFPTIGYDGQGFDGISNHIRYPEIPDTLSHSNFADSLMQYYNIALAYNTMAYDVGTAERYMSESDFGLKYADTLDSINLDGISNSVIGERLRAVSTNAAKLIRNGIAPSSQEDISVQQFYDSLNEFATPLLENHLSDNEFDPKEVLDDYYVIHKKALSDTTTFCLDLLERVMCEQNFSKKCVLAREYAYADYHSPQRDDGRLVGLLDMILRESKYSPLLRDFWRMWRVKLQIGFFGSRSNDGAIYNLFYNDMRNRIAMVYIAHLNSHPNDMIAFKEFIRLANDYNIVRNSGCLIGNNANLEDIELFYSVFNSK